MKKQLLNFSAALMMFLIIITISLAGAQPPKHPDPVAPSAVKLSVFIPEELTSSIVQQNADDADNAVYFKFKKSDGNTEFLFQVNRVTYTEWHQIKNQLPDAKFLASKNGNIYYALSTNKKKIKGNDADAYSHAYDRLNVMVNSIVITE